MDTLTHALSGALLGRATEPKTPRTDQLPRRLRMWIGFWAAAFPDSDFIVNFINPLSYLALHRGVTHSIILLPIWALGLAFLFMLIVRRKHSVTAFVGVCALGISIHIAGDVINAFGTMIFAPFSMWRAQISTTFVIDPFFTSIIVAGLIASFRWKVTVLRYGAVDADKELAEAAWNSDVLAPYRHFALFPALYRIDRDPESTCVWFNDLRFAVVGRTMPFRYGSCRDGINSPWKVHRLTSDDNGAELFEAIPD